MLPDDLFLLRVPGTPVLLPDGSAAVVPLSQPDADRDEYLGGLWLVPLDGSPARPLTRGHADSAPDVSPDGRWVVFVRSGGGAKPQLYVVEASGGEPFRVTDQPLGAGQPRFSPDGRRIAYVARVPEDGRYVADGDPGAERPRLITQLRNRVDGVGHLRDRVRQVFVLELPDTRGAAVAVPPSYALTSADDDVDLPHWFPDGSAVAALLRRHAGREDDLRRDAVALLVPQDLETVDGTAPVVPLTDADAGANLAVSRAVPAPDGSRVWVLAEDVDESGRDFVAALTGLFEVPLAQGRPTGPARRLTDADTVDLDPGVLVPVGDGVLVAPLRSGAVHLTRVGVHGDSRDLLDGAVVVGGAAAAAGAVVAVRGTPDSAGDLVLVGDGPDEAARTGRALTDWSAPLRATGRVRAPEPLVAHAPDGYRVEGWLTTPDPERFGAGPHPTVLLIHGGPFAQYTHELFDEVQTLAEAGYAVVHGNPRGSSGRGRAHGRAILRAFGTVDADDVIALLDEALTDPRLDAQRTGVMGGSYGGYLTAWLTTRTQRFAAAIVERGFLDPVSFTGSSDIGWFFGLEYLGDPDTEADLVAAQSPMAHVGEVRTPTLVVHSEQDWRCPVEQGQRWFVELRRRGVPSELLLFPGEGHELTRSGRPSHRAVRFEHVLRWWQRWLPVKPAEREIV
ncbi:S9 family peptidase [Cellulomonas palmilytica]|uniref:S9 family peptidase n=1 Tax=Cellulomonas palmilytica TaxID=2608402 RepID=UPI001F187C86|nr:S9 family peptidase [Cellulomonas palmilytica]UJP38750.1 S9 family peptidase [Cellulomonas palmilytica]